MVFGLHIYLSNRLEALVEHLAALLIKPVYHDTLFPLRSEVVIVQSRGMERWVSQELARINGICGNVIFPFPNAFLKELFDYFLPHGSNQAIFDPPVMTFRVMEILPGLLHLKEFRTLAGYLENDLSGLKLFQLSSKIADTFDQYLIFRTEEIFQWEKGVTEKREDLSWQSVLWRALINDIPANHQARLRENFLKEVSKRSEKQCRLMNQYPRISLFALSYLPDFHLKVIESLSEISSIHLFLMNPSKEYWADIVTDKEKLRIKKRTIDRSFDEVDHYFEKGNRVLASLGELSKYFFSQILEMDARWTESFKDPCSEGLRATEDMTAVTLLSAFQRDILYLHDRILSPADNIDFSFKDRSIGIHSCHSPMREIEVLYDQILCMFASDSGLYPHDILVVTPNVGTYAPYIKAVFDSGRREQPRIPYSISDQNTGTEKRGVSDFFYILGLAGTRLGLSSVIHLFESDVIRGRFEIEEKEIDLIVEWFQKSYIRWGINGSHRKEFGLKEYHDNTWERGIERLLLGYALAGYDRRSCDDILPYDDIEGGDSVLLGKVVTLIQLLVNVISLIETPASLSEWSRRLKWILKSFFIGEEGLPSELLFLSNLIQDLSLKEDLSHLRRPLGVDVIILYLKRELEQEHAKKGNLFKGISFCSMARVRSIPSKVICMVGMNYDAFPRMDHSPSFNLLSKHPKSTDYSTRVDDKYLFLESILSARRILYISYIGQSIRDNAKIPPSVVVSEMMDYLIHGFRLREDDLITIHKLQSFSAAYYENSERLWSYSIDDYNAIVRSHQSKKQRKFFSRPLPLPASHFRNVTLSQLFDFFSNPSRYILVNRLRLSFISEEIPICDSENFHLKGLDRYRVGETLLKKSLEGSKLDDSYTIERMRGILPVGNLGKAVFDDVKNEVIAFQKKLVRFTSGETPVKRTGELKIDDYTIEGDLFPIHTCGLLIYRFSEIRPTDILSAFLSHLFFLALPDDFFIKYEERRTYMIMKNDIWCFHPVPQCRNVLKEYLDIYWKGLQNPVPLFRNASFEYSKRRFMQKKKREDGLSAALKVWNGGFLGRGDSKDPYHSLCYMNENPIDENFERIAESVYGPIFSSVSMV